MTGDADYLLRVVVADVSAYERFLRDALTRIESAAGIKSSFALKQVKYSTALPLSGSLVAHNPPASLKLPDRAYRSADKPVSSTSRRVQRPRR